MATAGGGGVRGPGRACVGAEWGRNRGSVSQKILEGAFLVALVGDVRQVDPAEVGGMVQDHVAHVEGEDVVFEVLLQVRKKPVRCSTKSPETCEP